MFKRSAESYWACAFPSTRNCMRVPDWSRKSPLRVLSTEFIPVDWSAEACDSRWIWRAGVLRFSAELLPKDEFVSEPTVPPTPFKVEPAAPAADPAAPAVAPTADPTVEPTPPTSPPPPPLEGAASGGAMGGAIGSMPP